MCLLNYISFSFAGELTTVDIITREPQQETYTLDLQIIDSGEPRLSSKGQVIIHTSVNKPPAVVKTYYFKVQENVTSGFTVGKINASDPNNNTRMKDKLTFSVSNFNSKNLFISIYVSMCDSRYSPLRSHLQTYTLH